MAVIATGRYTFTQTLYVLATRTAFLLGRNPQSLLNALVVRPGSDGLDEAKSQFAELANRHNKNMLALIRSLRRTSDTVTVTASGQSAAIPSDVFRSNIAEVRYSSASSAANLYPIQFVGKVDSRSFPPRIMNGQYTSQYAQFVALDQTEENLLFFPWLAVETDFILMFQQAPDLFVAADYDDPDSETYAVVPDDYSDVLPTLMAAEIAGIMAMNERQDRLRDDLAGNAQNGYMGIISRFADAISDVPANSLRRRYSYSDQHPAALQDTFAGVNFSNSVRTYYTG